MKINRTTYLSLGSNLGDKLKNLQQAVDIVGEKVGHIKKISSVYETKSWGFDGGNFFNICIELNTSLNPEDLLKMVLSIEKELGRERRSNSNYEDRIIDIDVLLFEDDVIFYNDLKVPHPRMLERKFVLVPLAEIAPSFIHPIVKNNIANCLKSCLDPTEVKKISLALIRPVSLVEKYNYIAIEGNIGSGKTTLAKKIGDDFNARLVLERFADNAFLPKFYEDQERYAFTLEMSFLADRYHQLSDGIAQFDLFKNFIVSDYFIFKSLIFAQVTLSKEEYTLYRKMFDILYKEISKPDIYVYLYQSTSRLVDNIKKRGRSYEQNIQPEYLEKIHSGYLNFIKTREQLNTIIIDVTELDFVNNISDYQTVVKKISEFKKP